MPIDREALRAGIAPILARLEAEHQMLTELDGRVGDGDLGLTLLKAFRALDGLRHGLPADLGQALAQMGSAVAKVSSSSFGTLMATGLLAAARALKGREAAEWSELPALVRAAREAMQARGKAELGDKTVLDALAAIEKAATGRDDPAAQLAAARQGVDEAIEAFRGQPNKVGRARVYAERTIGIDDPGMVAMRVMLAAL
jgi:dihydroxyacetone kinase-like protein